MALAATLACVLEASASKVGNVTPTRAFANMRLADFVDSAAALGPAIAAARPGRVGWAAWKAVAAARRLRRSGPGEAGGPGSAPEACRVEWEPAWRHARGKVFRLGPCATRPGRS